MTGHNASEPYRPHPLKYILILSFHLYPDTLRGLFSSGFHIKTAITFCIPRPSHSIGLITLMIFVEVQVA
jgi:hypothetical protein